MAVKVTDEPVQTGLADAEMVTFTGRTGTTFIVTRFEIAGLPVVHDKPEVS